LNLESGLKDSRIEGFKNEGFKDSKDSRIQGFKIRGFKDSRIQRFKVSRIQRVLESLIFEYVCESINRRILDVDTSTNMWGWIHEGCD
jgi:hypothetical protein